MSEQTAEPQVIDAPAQRAPYEPVHEDEGHSAAGWIGVIVILLGAAAIAVGLFIEQMMVVYIGIGAVVLGAILWPALKAAGLGPKTH